MRQFLHVAVKGGKDIPKGRGIRTRLKGRMPPALPFVNAHSQFLAGFVYGFCGGDIVRYNPFQGEHAPSNPRKSGNFADNARKAITKGLYVSGRARQILASFFRRRANAVYGLSGFVGDIAGFIQLALGIADFAFEAHSIKQQLDDKFTSGCHECSSSWRYGNPRRLSPAA